MAYAIIETGGKQYKVTEGRWLDVELLAEESGAEVSFDRVLLVGTDAGVQVGTPLLADAKVVGKVLAEVKGTKVVSFKYRPKKGYQRKIVHRQRYTRVLIEKIQAS